MISRSLHRHVCEICFLVAISVVGIFLWEYLSGNPKVSSPFVVDAISTIIASVTALLCVIVYVWVPKKPFLISFTIFLLTLSIVSVLIVQTNGLSSPFIAIWTLLSLLAYLFGFLGILATILPICIFSIFQYLDVGTLSIESITIIVAGGLLPLFASMIIWRKETTDDKPIKNEPTYQKTNNEINEFTQKSEIIINAIGDGVIAIDSTGIIKLINPAAQNIVGWNMHDAVSLNFRSVLKLTDKQNKPFDGPNDPISQVLNFNQQVRINDIGLETKSGKNIIISLVVSPIGDAGSGVIATFRDITKEKSEEREQAEFISTASHEMRTPVASIEGYIGLAMNPQTAQIDIRAREYLNKAHQSAQHLGRLFQDLLDISKADDGRLKNNPKLINIVTFTKNIVQNFKQKAAEKGLRLIFKPIPDDDNVKHIVPDYSVNLDNDHLHEIIDNLIENAIKYTQKGSIIVDVVGSEDHVVISVQDSGIGISAEDIPHLFQKFYRIDNKDTREIGGTGLGLYLSRRLAESLNGRIWVESTPGAGSTFFVDLPRVSNQQATIIAEQRTLIDQQKAQQQLPLPQPQPSAPQPQTATTQTMDIIRPTNNVPRGQALSPQQIAAYVAQQHSLATQQPKPADAPTQPQRARTQAVYIPPR